LLPNQLALPKVLGVVGCGRDCRFSLRSKRPPNPLALPKVFPSNRVGFVAKIRASLEDFAEDVHSMLEVVLLKFKFKINKYKIYLMYKLLYSSVI